MTPETAGGESAPEEAVRGAGPGPGLYLNQDGGLRASLGDPLGGSVGGGVGERGGVSEGLAASPRTLLYPWGTLDTWESLTPTP